MDTFFQWVDRAEQATALVRYDIWRRSVDRPTTIHYMSVLVVSSILFGASFFCSKLGGPLIIAALDYIMVLHYYLF